MEKKKKIRISIISAVVAVVLIASGLLTYLLLSKNDDNKKLKTLLANVSSQIFASYNDLAESYNSETTAQAVCYSSPSNTSISVVASPVSETGNDDIWNLTQGTDTFQDYLDNINNVMAHYAIAEYLVNESNGIDLKKAYHFKSSTVEYYATADYVENEYFSFTIQNDDEKIRVRVNIKEGEDFGESIEFFKEAKIEGNKYYYQYSILNLKASTYDEIIITTNNQYNGSFNNNWVDNNVEQHHQHNIDHHNRDSYIGKKYVRNDGSANQHSDPRSNDIYNNIYDHKDKLFNHFDDYKYNKNITTEFPNAQGMQDYAFNKYVAKIMTDTNGKQVLHITRNATVVDKNFLFNKEKFNFNGDVWYWEYQDGFEVVSQIFCNKLLSKDARQVNLADFSNSNSKKLEIVCKKDGEYYSFNISSISSISSSGSYVMTSDPLTIFSSFSLGGNHEWVWEYKEGFEVVSQRFCGTVLSNNIRQVNLANFSNFNSKNLIIVCKKGETTYNYHYYSDSSMGSCKDLSQLGLGFSYEFEYIISYSNGQESMETSNTMKVSFDDENYTIISWGYNKVEDVFWGIGEKVEYEIIFSEYEIKTPNAELNINDRSFETNEFGNYEVVVYYKNTDEVYKSTLLITFNKITL